VLVQQTPGEVGAGGEVGLGVGVEGVEVMTLLVSTIRERRNGGPALEAKQLGEHLAGCRNKDIQADRPSHGSNKIDGPRDDGTGAAELRYGPSAG
jgi:hypothetical protein